MTKVITGQQMYEVCFFKTATSSELRQTTVQTMTRVVIVLTHEKRHFIFFHRFGQRGVKTKEGIKLDGNCTPEDLAAL